MHYQKTSCVYLHVCQNRQFSKSVRLKDSKKQMNNWEAFQTKSFYDFFKKEIYPNVAKVFIEACERLTSLEIIHNDILVNKDSKRG